MEVELDVVAAADLGLQPLAALQPGPQGLLQEGEGPTLLCRWDQWGTIKRYKTRGLRCWGAERGKRQTQTQPSEEGPCPLTREPLSG